MLDYTKIYTIIYIYIYIYIYIILEKFFFFIDLVEFFSHTLTSYEATQFKCNHIYIYIYICMYACIHMNFGHLLIVSGGHSLSYESTTFLYHPQSTLYSCSKSCVPKLFPQLN